MWVFSLSYIWALHQLGIHTNNEFLLTCSCENDGTDQVPKLGRLYGWRTFALSFFLAFLATTFLFIHERVMFTPTQYLLGYFLEHMISNLHAIYQYSRRYASKPGRTTIWLMFCNLLQGYFSHHFYICWC